MSISNKSIVQAINEVLNNPDGTSEASFLDGKVSSVGNHKYVRRRKKLNLTDSGKSLGARYAQTRNKRTPGISKPQTERMQKQVQAAGLKEASKQARTETIKSETASDWLSEPEYFDSKYPKKRYIPITTPEQNLKSVLGKITSADVFVIDLEAMSPDIAIMWLNEAHELSRLPGKFSVPTILVVGKSITLPLTERYRLKENILNAGALFYEWPVGCSNLDQVLSYMKENDEKRLKAFNKSEKDYYYSSYLNE